MNTAGYRHILVGTDLGPDAQRVLRETLRIARRDRSRVTVLVAAPTVASTARARADLAALLTRFPDDRLDIDGHTVQGHPAASLSAMSADLKCDLVVVAATRKGLLERFAVGSTAEALVRDCRAPVLVVGPEAAGPRRVIVGVGYTRECKLALRAGYVQAFRDGAVLEAVHVGPSEGASAVRSDPSVETGLRQVSEGASALRTYLGVSIPRQIHDQSVEARHLLGWQPSLAIAKHAQETGATLVVLGRHRPTLRRLLLGTTGQRVMRGLPCSLLAVGAPRLS